MRGRYGANPAVAMNGWTGELSVLAVVRDGTDVRVDLVGGDNMLCGSLLYEFDDEEELDRNAKVLARWRDQGTPVVAFKEDDVITLIDPRAVVENLLSELFEASS